jgi:hypothetical protein
MIGNIHLLGTERYKSGRYGWKEYTYLSVGDMLEERTLTGRGDSWVVTRYIGVTETDHRAIAEQVTKLSQAPRKSARGHDELRKLLRAYPQISGYVDIGEIDAPDRKVIIATSINMPFDARQSREQWQSYFKLGDVEGGL